MDLTRKTIREASDFGALSDDCLEALRLAREAANTTKTGENGGTEDTKEVDVDKKTDSLNEKK